MGEQWLPWPNSESFLLQLAILPWYSDGLVPKSKFLSVSSLRIRQANRITQVIYRRWM